MDALVADLVAKILTQCGILASGLVFLLGVVWTKWGKDRIAWDADRAAMVKQYEAQSDVISKMAVAHAELKGILLALQAKGNSQ